jgi:hypothetical protein
MKTKSSIILLLGFLLGVLAGCGVAENSLPTVLPKGDSTLSYGLTFFQTSEVNQIGDEFVIAPTLKSSWGIGNYLEISLKTFGLGLGGEIKRELYRKKIFVISAAAEGNFSFPMMGYLTSKVMPVNENFINFVTNSFYFAGAKLFTGFLWEKIVLSVHLRGGYLDNAGFLPEMGSAGGSNFPGFVYQPGISVFFRENAYAKLALGLEAGIVMPNQLVYIGGSYRF